MNNSYSIKNAKLSEKNRTCSFDFVDGQFRLSVKGTYTPDPFRVNVSPVKMTFLSEPVLSIGGAGKYGMKPVVRTESYVLPLSMLDRFFNLLRKQWQDGRERVLSNDGVDKFMQGLYDAGLVSDKYVAKKKATRKTKQHGSKQTRR